jgi:tetratricopeptide (TPR) repeat protein
MYGAPGILTAFLVCAGGSSISLLWPMGRWQRVLGAVIGMLVITATVITAARSAWLAVGAAAAATVVVAVLTGGRVRLPAPRRARVGLGAVGLIAVSAAVAIAPAIARRLTAGGGEEFRATLITVAARLFSQHPLTGAGLGTWVTYRLPLTQAGEQDYYIPHAHDAPIQLLAETGLLGAVVAFVAILAVAHLVLRAVRSADPTRRALALGTVFVLTYLFVHQLFDFFLDMPAVMFAAILPVAALDAIETRSMSPAADRPSVRALALVPAIAAFAAASFILSLERPAFLSDSAVAAMPDDPGRAILLEDEALGDDPGHPAYLWTRGLAEAASGGDADHAISDLLAVADHDDLPQAWLDVAWLYLQRGDRAGADDSLQRALRLGIQQPAVTIAAIPMLLELGRHDRAEEAAAAALEVAPTLVDDPWWSSSPDLARTRDAAVDDALATADPYRAWQIALLAGRADQARSIAQGLPPDEQAIAVPAIDAWLGVPGAFERLEATATANPLAGAATWAARIADKEGDTAAADRFHRWAAIGYGTSGSDFGYDTVVTNDPHASIGAPGPNAAFHDRYVYRRSSPADMLVGNLPRLTVR